MKQTYNIAISIRDVGHIRGNLFIVSHAALKDGNPSCLALNRACVLSLLSFIKVRPAEEKRINEELFIKGESSVRDVQVGPGEFADPVWGNYFEILHRCSKNAALAAAAARAREARAQYKRQVHE
jgi:hypothetical protein